MCCFFIDFKAILLYFADWYCVERVYIVHVCHFVLDFYVCILLNAHDCRSASDEHRRRLSSKFDWKHDFITFNFPFTTKCCRLGVFSVVENSIDMVCIRNSMCILSLFLKHCFKIVLSLWFFDGNPVLCTAATHSTYTSLQHQCTDMHDGTVCMGHGKYRLSLLRMRVPIH